jgi:hypothetical protein
MFSSVGHAFSGAAGAASGAASDRSAPGGHSLFSNLGVTYVSPRGQAITHFGDQTVFDSRDNIAGTPWGVKRNNVGGVETVEYTSTAGGFSRTGITMNSLSIAALRASDTHSTTATERDVVTKAENRFVSSVFEHLASFGNSYGEDEQSQRAKKLEEAFKSEVLKIFKQSDSEEVNAKLYAKIDAGMSLEFGTGWASKLLSSSSEGGSATDIKKRGGGTVPEQHDTDYMKEDETKQKTSGKMLDFAVKLAGEVGAEFDLNVKSLDTKELQDRLTKTSQQVTSDMVSKGNRISETASEIDSNKVNKARSTMNAAQKSWETTNTEQSTLSEDTFKRYGQKLVDWGYSDEDIREQIVWLNSAGKEAARAEIMQVLGKSDFAQYVEEKIKLGNEAATAPIPTGKVAQEVAAAKLKAQQAIADKQAFVDQGTDGTNKAGGINGPNARDKGDKAKAVGKTFLNGVPAN